MEKEKRILETIFLREKPARILLSMKTSKDESIYTSLLAKESDCTYSHTVKILNQFKDMGIVNFEKIGRIKKITLTPDGKEIANNMDSIMRKFIQIEEAAMKANKENRKKNGKK